MISIRLKSNLESLVTTDNAALMTPETPIFEKPMLDAYSIIKAALDKYTRDLALFALMLLTFLIFPVFSGFALAGEVTLKQVSGANNLEKVKRSQFSETYVKPGVDFSVYNTIYVDEARFAYRDVKPAKMGSGTHSNTTSKQEYPISQEGREQFEAIVRETFRTEIGKAKHFEIVDILNTDEHTLVMRAMVADIVSRIPPETVEQTRLYMSSVGGATLTLEFRDNTSREVLARVAERGLIGDSSHQVNRDTVIADVRRWATDAAIKLRRVLDTALE